jgi:vacuolar-type H+-ATPase subunit E/Vma4
MSAEKIIQQIKRDTEIEIEIIDKEKKKRIEEITNNLKQETNEMKKDILEKGKLDAENVKRIELAKANQEVKRAQMLAKEQLIETCFKNALSQLKDLDKSSYEKIVKSLIKKGSSQINGSFNIQTSRSIDKDVAKKQHIKIEGSIEATGGIKLVSEDRSVIIDNTFEGILNRKKQDIRIHVGSILFK